jgi:hypothetical protein
MILQTRSFDFMACFLRAIEAKYVLKTLLAFTKQDNLINRDYVE